MSGMGSRIRLLLERNELSQKALAEKINISATAMNNYVQDLRSPSLEVLSKMCDELHCSADYLLGRKDEPIIRLTDEEATLIRVWRKTEDEDLKALIKRNLGIIEKKKRGVS